MTVIRVQSFELHLAWASHLVIMLGIHQEGQISENLETDHYFLIMATRGIFFEEMSLEHSYYTFYIT